MKETPEKRLNHLPARCNLRPASISQGPSSLDGNSYRSQLSGSRYAALEMQEEDTAHEEPYRRKVQAGSAEGHLGPVGSSAGCSGA